MSSENDSLYKRKDRKSVDLEGKRHYLPTSRSHSLSCSLQPGDVFRLTREVNTEYGILYLGAHPPFSHGSPHF